MIGLDGRESSENKEKILINDFVDELIVGLMNTRIYWNDHPRVTYSVEEMVKMMPRLQSEYKSEEFEIHVTENRIIYDRRPLLGASVSAPKLMEAMADRKVGGIRFVGLPEEHEYRELLRVLVDKPEADFTVDSLNLELRNEQCTAIELLAAPEKGTGDGSNAAKASVGVYQSLVKVMQEMAMSIAHGGMINFDQSFAAVQKSLQNLRSDSPASLMTAVRYEQYEAFTFGHSVRVSIMALEFARAFVEDDDVLHRIGAAALTHDVGKVRTPFDLWQTKEPLSIEQQIEVQRHAEYGAEILMDQENCDPMAYAAAFGHHLGENGTGYPRLMHQPEISLVTEIVKLCDIFEALTAVRPHRPAMAPSKAFRVMMSMGDALDRGMLKHFIKVMGVYPLGSRLRLASGELAVVQGQSRDLYRPAVTIESTPDGDALPEEEFRRVDLSAAPELQVVGLEENAWTSVPAS